MPYGQIKVDEITFTNAGVDQTISVSGVVASISGNITATGTISGDVIRGGTLVSGATVTGTAGQFGTITGNTAGFTTVTGTTVTGTTAQFTTVTGGTAGFTTITGTTVTGTTANFVTVSGTTVTGNVGNFTTVTGGTVTLTSGVFGAGTASLPSISFTSDPNTGIYSPGADQVAVATNGTGRLFVNSTGLVGVGTSSPSAKLEINTGADENALLLRRQSGDPVALVLRTYNDADKDVLIKNNNGALNFYTGNPVLSRLYIHPAGRVGIGTTSPSQTLHVVGASTTNPSILLAETSGSSLQIISGASDSFIGTNGSTPLRFGTAFTERARIDTSGRLLVGTSSARDKFFNAASGENPVVQFEGAGTTAQGLYMLSLTANNTSSSSGAGASLILARSGGTSVGSYTTVSDGQNLGRISFQGADGSEFVEGASISALADGGVGANDLPSRLVFSVTADGSSSPTEAMRLENTGTMRVSGTIYRNGNSGLRFSGSAVIPQGSTGGNADNDIDLGLSGSRWRTIYAGTGTINTSDFNLKQDVEELDQAELSVAATIKGLIKKFRFTDAVAAKGNDARIHVGVIAQEVEQAFAAEGLNPRRYGMFCEDKLEDGSKRLGIRYDELLAFVIAAL